MKALIQGEIDRFNQNLDRQEKIRRFALLPRDFTIEDDEITPSLKVKRKNIDKKYKNVIDQLYADENSWKHVMTSVAEAPSHDRRARVRRSSARAIWPSSGSICRARR